MTLESNAQELFVIDPISPASQLPADVHSVEAMPPHMHEGEEQLLSLSPLEVAEPVDVEIVVEELPGAPAGTKDPEPIIEVADEPIRAEEKPEDANDAKKKKNDKWDWEAHGAHGFTNWIRSRLNDVPKHSGQDSAGLERAIAFLERLDNEISKAMRMDLDGELDANKIEKVRADLDDGLARLHARLEKVKKAKKSARKKKAEEELGDDGFVKEAQKIAGIQGIYVTVPAFIFGIARVCINGTVSAGHDIEDMFNRLCKKYNLDNREKFELIQCLFDMGYPLGHIDRGFLPDEDIEVWDSDNFDWAANYRG